MEYAVFKKDWNSIEDQDRPWGHLTICHDPQKRLGEPTWVVIRTKMEPDVTQLGLFWDLNQAIRYAESFKDAWKLRGVSDGDD